MMKSLFFKLILLIGVCTVTNQMALPTYAQEMKFAYMDFVRVFNEADKFQSMKQELETLRQKKEQELERKRMSLIEEFNLFETKRELMNQQSVQQRQQELLQEKNTLLSEMQQEQMNLNDIKSDRLDPLIDQLKVVVESIAKEQGYMFVFKKVNLAYGDPRFDITDQVIARMNNQ